ncbi:MAG: O-antigen ligase family protein [Myxococcota bacterium]
MADSAALSGRSVRPLALDTPSALQVGAWMTAWTPLVLATIIMLRSAPGRRRRLEDAILLSAVLVVVLEILQRLTGAPSIYWVSGLFSAKSRSFGSFINPNHAGALLAVAGTIALSRRTAAGASLAGGLGLATLATGSRGALLAFVVGATVALCLDGGPRLRAGIATAAAGLGLLVVALDPRKVFEKLSLRIIPEDHLQDVTTGRPQLWSDTVGLILDTPLLGVGLGSFEAAFPAVKDSVRFATISHAHSEPLQAFAEHGVVLGMVWIGLVLAALRYAQTRRQHGWLAAAIALISASLVDFPLRLGALSLLAAVLAGGLLADEDAEGSPLSLPLQRLSGGAMAASVGLLIAWIVTPSAETVFAHNDPQAALQKAPLHWRSAQKMGGQRWSAGDLDGAEAAYRFAARSYPTHYSSWLNLARLREARGDLEGAWAMWRETLTLNLPNNNDALAYIEEALETGPDPIAAAEAAIPDRADRLVLSARALTRDVDTPARRAAAERLYLRAMAQDPGRAVPYARDLLRWGRPEEALALVEEMPTRLCDPTRIAAQAAEAVGRFSVAKNRYQHATRTCPARKRDGLEKGLFRSRLALGEADAIEAAQAQLERRPNDLTLRRRLLSGLAKAPTKNRALLIGHLEFLVLEGNATLEENEDLIDMLAGLPPKHLLTPE